MRMYNIICIRHYVYNMLAVQIAYTHHIIIYTCNVNLISAVHKSMNSNNTKLCHACTYKHTLHHSTFNALHLYIQYSRKNPNTSNAKPCHACTYKQHGLKAHFQCTQRNWNTWLNTLPEYASTLVIVVVESKIRVQATDNKPTQHYKAAVHTFWAG